MNEFNLEEYDIHRLKEIRRTLEKIHTYYYGSWKHRKATKRIVTLLKKIDELIGGA